MEQLAERKDMKDIDDIKSELGKIAASANYLSKCQDPMGSSVFNRFVSESTVFLLKWQYLGLSRSACREKRPGD